MTAAALSRAEHLARLVAAPVDVLVIGGGITGAGVALDAASRGYSVGLVDQADFASGTSSRSTKLIHGGIRYLAKGQVQLVREALHERTVLLRLAPWLVRPQLFLIPLYAHLRQPLGLVVPALLRSLAPIGIGIGLWAYDRFARNAALAHRRISAGEVAQLAPALITDGLQMAFLYYDARADDVRLTHAVLRSARRYGALTVNHARVCAFIRQQGRVSGVQVEDGLTGRSYDIGARQVVNATGVWSEQVAGLDSPPPFRVKPSRGTHLVLRKESVTAQTSLVIPETDDGRLLFLTPWAGRLLLGTTDEPYTGTLDAPRASAGEIRYLLDHANRYLSPPIEPSAIVGVFAGLRPLVVSRDAESKALSREHVVVTSPSGLIHILGGKLTSYRKMAADTVDEITRRLGDRRDSRTATLALDGTDGWEETRRVVAASGLSTEEQAHIVEAYGSGAAQLLELVKHSGDLRVPLAPQHLVLAAEVVHACRVEMCVSLADFMIVRSRLSVVADDAGALAVDRVSALMTEELRWDTAERTRQRETWEGLVARDRSALGEVQHALASSRPPCRAS